MRSSAFAAALALGLASGLAASLAAAQDTAPPAAPPAAPEAAPDAPAAGTEGAPSTAADTLSMGVPAEAEADGGIGSIYVAEVHGDWEQRCVRAADGADPCQLYQLLRDEENNPVAEFSLFGLPAGGEAAAGATVIVPLETLLTEQLVIAIDNGQARRYPFAWCSQIGCIARIGLTAAEVDGMRKGNEARVIIVPAAAPDKKVILKVSLKGFTAGLKAVDAANAAVPPPPANPDGAAPAAPAEAPADTPADTPAEAPAAGN
jgi:invasion protein IalB